MPHFRILYGRMLGKTGSTKRKIPIFHFLAGCSESELNEFLHLLLVPVAVMVSECEGKKMEILVPQTALTRFFSYSRIDGKMPVSRGKIRSRAIDKSEEITGVRFCNNLFVLANLIFSCTGSFQICTSSSENWAICSAINQRLDFGDY